VSAVVEIAGIVHIFFEIVGHDPSPGGVRTAYCTR
jgi:hypothetical protein